MMKLFFVPLPFSFPFGHLHPKINFLWSLGLCIVPSVSYRSTLNFAHFLQAPEAQIVLFFHHQLLDQSKSGDKTAEMKEK